MKRDLNTASALAAILALSLPALTSRAGAQTVSAQPQANDPAISAYAIAPSDDPMPPLAEMTDLMRRKIKYVFVIFNENESFDHEYGTFPGVDGVYSDGVNARVPDNAAQTYVDAGSGATVTVRPFLIGPMQNATFSDSVDHSHAGLSRKLNVVDGAARLDGFAAREYGRFNTPPGDKGAQAKGAQFARLVMSHIDCDTIPFFWRYASRFTIFDNIFATQNTPSSPNAVAMLAGQAGETQWVKRGAVGSTQGPPLVNDPQPFWGSVFDATELHRQPTAPKEFWGKSNIAPNLTFANVLLTLAGGSVASLMSRVNNPSDVADIQNDIAYIQSRGGPNVGWRWYQNGYSVEPNDATAPNGALAESGLPHQNYVSHHQGPQYFGYIADNPAEAPNMKGENDFFDDIANDKLPAGGGVIYIRGGYYNLKNTLPPIQNPHYPNAAGDTADDLAAIDKAKGGDDDHPGYSDHQITEAMNARVINAIANNPELWSQSAIIIAYDESDGFYDHAPPRILSYGPDGQPLSRGARIPLLLISPYARAHAVSHAEGDHNAIIETINAIFNLPALSSLPDEATALAAGDAPQFNQFGPAGFHQRHLGPRDANSAMTDNLLSGFSPDRLRGVAPALPGSYAAIASDIVESFPHYAVNGVTNGCSAIGVTPVPPPGRNADDPPPAGFNTLPMTLPAYN